MEMVARLARLARMPTRAHAQVTAAVGFETPADECGRVRFEDRTLPGRQRDRASVLPAGAMLGEQHRPRVGVGAGDDDSTPVPQSDRVAWTKHTDRFGHAADHSLLTGTFQAAGQLV
jgi:hypothetical protein